MNPGDDDELLVIRSAIQAIRSPLAQRYSPWVTPDGYSPQAKLEDALCRSKQVLYRGGNRTGKTLGCSAVVTGFASRQLTRLHVPEPVRVWISSVSFEDGVGGMVWPVMRQFVPDSVKAKATWWRKRGPEVPRYLPWPDGSSIEFKSAEQGRDKFQGAGLHLCWVDEEHPEDVVEEIRMRLLDSDGWLLVSATPVRREPWLKEYEREAETITIRASTLQAAEAGVLSKEAVERRFANLSERQRQIRIEGDYGSFEGLVFKEFDRRIHGLRVGSGHLVNDDGRKVAPWPIPHHWRKFSGIDFGTGVPTAVLVAAQDPESRRLVVFRMLYSAEIRISKWAQLILDLVPPLDAPPWCDHDRAERLELEGQGIATTPAKKDVTAGLEEVESMLEVRRDGLPGIMFLLDETLQTHPVLGRLDCEMLAWELERYHYPKRKGKGPDPARDLPVKKDDHACDALRYLIMGLRRDVTGTEGDDLGARLIFD